MSKLMRSTKLATRSKKLPEMVDDLGFIKDKITELQIQETEIRNSLTQVLNFLRSKIVKLQAEEIQIQKCLIEAGIDSVEGKSFCAIVSRSSDKTIDYINLVEHLAPSSRILAKYTTVEDHTLVRVVPRNSQL